MARAVIRSAVDRVRSYARSRARSKQYSTVYRKYRDYTMIPKDYYIANLRISQMWPLPAGSVVECGTWRGGMIAGLADVLGPTRDYFLFDSFEGLPQAKEIDGEAAIRWQSDTSGPQYFDNCTAPIEIAERAMAMSLATRYQIFKGWFDRTLPTFRPPGPIALLRLDADWFESTITCLEFLYPLLAPKSIILVDDYYIWDGCSKAIHHYLARVDSTARIQRIDGVCTINLR